VPSYIFKHFRVALAMNFEKLLESERLKKATMKQKNTSIVITLVLGLQFSGVSTYTQNSSQVSKSIVHPRCCSVFTILIFKVLKSFLLDEQMWYFI